MTIYDDLLPSELFERQIEIIKSTQWGYQTTTYGNDQLSFSRSIEFKHDWESEWYWTVNIIICARFPHLKGLQLERVRLGLLTRGQEQILNPPHVDFHYPTYTGLLYLNDVDGDTHFYKERFESVEKEQKLRKNNSFTLDRKVSPKANRLILFDGNIYHSSQTPTTEAYRWVINFNWRKE